MTQDYGKTLNLPKTEFSMRANLPKKEPSVLEKWNELNLYEKLMQKNEGNPLYVLHDGPPYANGDIHVGHTLNKILKDIIVKYKNMTHFKSPYVPGWDTHGLPIEHKTINKMKINRHEIDPVEFRRVCKDFALSYVDVQKDQFKRLGIIGDWDNPYITLYPEFEAKQVEVFGEMAKKGYIYKGLKPVFWCADCETALAEAEIEYSESKTRSVYVKFPVKDEKNKLNDYIGETDPYFVIWTTTTWTIPGNMAICVNRDFEYSLIKSGDESYIVATELVEDVMKAGGIEEYTELAKFNGSELEGIICKHPFIDRESPIILGDHVTLEAGTGCVHTAPGHGQEDFEIGKEYGLDVVVPVNDEGMLTNESGPFEGLSYVDANTAIRNYLDENNYLFAQQKVVHQYPHCWRCKNPILFRVTEQWFASVKGFRDQALQSIKDVRWIPSWGEERISNMVADREDWCISRQRYWGVPIPIFYCQSCDKELITDETIKTVKDLFMEKGSDSWYQLEAHEILPQNIQCECGCKSFRKETDIMDVWFDSGSTHAAVLEQRDDLKWPADIYLEGSDQHRGWFQSSLLTAVATRGSAPYEAVLTHGFLVDGEGRKMSKSLGNVVDPLKVIKQFGADILRLWVVSADYKHDIGISQEILKQLSDVYKKIRNTSRYMLGNINDFDPSRDALDYEDLLEIDKWALLRLNKLVQKVTDAYENFEFNLVYHAIYNFCVVDMSNFYLDTLKDRLYTELADSKLRRSAQTVLYEILNSMVVMLSPILSFTCEEIWDLIPKKSDQNVESVMLLDWPKQNEKYNDKDLEEKWNKIIELKSDVAKALELAREEKVIGDSLNAEIILYANEEQLSFINSISGIDQIFIVSKVSVLPLNQAPENAYESQNYSGIKILVDKAPGEKCERCWIFSEEVGENKDHPNLCHRCSSVMNELE